MFFYVFLYQRSGQDWIWATKKDTDTAQVWVGLRSRSDAGTAPQFLQPGGQNPHIFSGPAVPASGRNRVGNNSFEQKIYEKTQNTPIF